MIRRSKPKIGLALGSGSARGLAHIGVLKALKEKNISIDVIAGSSMGAFVGACYARNEDITDLEEVVLNLDWKQFAQLADPNLALLFKGIFSGKKVKELLRTIIGDVKFKDLKIPLAVVTTDVNTGEEIVIKEGSVIEAIPSIFDAIIQAIYAMEYEIAKLKVKEADIIITPDTRHIAALEFYRGKEAIAEGYKAANEALSKKDISLLSK